MKCPKCDSDMEKVTIENLELDRCIACNGIWFDEFELADFKEIKGSESVDIGNSSIGRKQNENDLINAGKDADVMLVGTVPHTTRKVLESLPKLKMVGRSGVGVDSIDLDAATELGICVTNTPGINTSEVADHALSLIHI